MRHLANFVHVSSATVSFLRRVSKYFALAGVPLYFDRWVCVFSSTTTCHFPAIRLLCYLPSVRIWVVSVLAYKTGGASLLHSNNPHFCARLLWQLIVWVPCACMHHRRDKSENLLFRGQPAQTAADTAGSAFYIGVHSLSYLCKLKTINGMDFYSTCTFRYHCEFAATP